MLSRSLFAMTLIAGLTSFVSTIYAQDVAPPPNAPATADWDAATGQLQLKYHGATILSAAVTAKDADGTSVAVKFESKADTATTNRRPCWVDEPASFYDEPRPDVVLAVGVASGKDARFTRTKARADALNQLAAALHGVQVTRQVNGPTGSTVVTRTKTSGTVSGARMLAQWMPPEGECFVLMAADKSQQK